MKSRFPTFFFTLLRNYFLSTFVPMLVITLIIAGVYNWNYNNDTNTLMETTMYSMNSSVDTYLKELDQLSMMPYYNNSFLAIVSELNKENKAPDTLDSINIERAVGNILTFSQYSRDDIEGTLIVSGSQCLFSSTKLIDCDLRDDYIYKDSSWYQAAIEADGKALYLPLSEMDYYTSTKNNSSLPNVMSVTRAIMNIRTRIPLCVIRIDANTAAFSKMFSSIEWHVPSVLIITDEKNNLVYSNKEIDTENLANLQTSKTSLIYSHNEWNVYHSNENSNQWNIYVLLDKTALRSKSYYIFFIAAIFYLIGLLGATALFGLYSRKMIRTVNTIGKMTDDIRNGKMNLEFPISENDGLTDVVEAVQYLAKQLQEKVQQEFQLRIQQKEFQFKALQSQINPHFLFNTLNGLIALNQIGETQRLDVSLHSLSEMLSYTLRGEETSTVKKEMDFLEDYCILQRLRFQKKLNFNINYDSDTTDYPIPKLILQPLVENAVIHGIEPSDHPCNLDIDVMKLRENVLSITIEDNGVGFNTAQSSSHIGIANVIERLRILNPKNTLDIESTPGEGTVINIILFVKHAKETPDTL